MVYEESFHDTKDKADAEGLRWMECWGWAYSGSYTTYQCLTTGQWICACRRWASCD